MAGPAPDKPNLLPPESLGGPPPSPWHDAGKWPVPPSEPREEPRPVTSDDPASGRTLVFDQKAFDFRSAMARNVRNAVGLCLLMALLAAVVGYSLGWSAEILMGSHPNAHPAGIHDLGSRPLLSRWGFIGIAILVAAVLVAALWALYGADDAVLAMNGARPASPEADKLLHHVVEEIALAAGAPTPTVFIVETPELNAFATGLRSDKAGVTVTRGLLERLNREELQGVVAHEFGHILNGDVRYMMMVAVVAGAIAFIASMAGRVRFRASDRAGIVALVWFLVALLAPVGALLVRMAVSRQREYLADATAAKMTRNPVALASALTKISSHPKVPAASPAVEHLYIVSPLRAFSNDASALFSTHPPTERRVERLMNLK